jgi:hypothetical protein
MIEYGPVEIGGKKYDCPLRSVVIMRARIYAPYETLLNDIVYTDYHKFGSEARMLPGFEVLPDAGGSPTKPPPNR